MRITASCLHRHHSQGSKPDHATPNTMETLMLVMITWTGLIGHALTPPPWKILPSHAHMEPMWDACLSVKIVIHERTFSGYAPKITSGYRIAVVMLTWVPCGLGQYMLNCFVASR